MNALNFDARRPLDAADLLPGRMLIGGEWVPAAAGRRLEVSNPATGETVAEVPAGDGEDARRAVDAAAAALSGWRRRPADERAQIVDRWADLLLERIGPLSHILTLEQGKPLAEAEGEIRYAASFLRWFAEEARRAGGYVLPPYGDRRITVLKEAVGVCVAITPWNFPAAMITRKAGPALAAGCTLVIKPSDLTPLTALALAALGEAAGLPPGVLNVVTGPPGPIGAELTANPIVRKLSFTGSTPVGALLMRQSADTIKRVSLELGGNAPFLVFDDADLDLAVAGAMTSKFRNAGQTCVCTNRFLVQAGVHDRFVAKLADRIGALKVGDGQAVGTTIGPLINAAAVAKVKAHVADAIDHGAQAVIAGDSFGGDISGGPGHFVGPTLLTRVSRQSRIAREETFGPVAAISAFESEAEAFEMANATPFGLAAYAYTRDVNRAWRLAEGLEAGMVGLNTGSVSIEAAPFGGVKQSGLGREGGREGIEEYLESKAIHWGGLDTA